MLSVVGKHDLGGMWPQTLFADDLEFTPCVEKVELLMAANEP